MKKFILSIVTKQINVVKIATKLKFKLHAKKLNLTIGLI